MISTSTVLAAPAPIADKNETINQVALLQSLSLGYFDGSIKVGDLKTLGDTGIGTFEGLDGEMIFVDGIVYRADSEGILSIVDDDTLVPFSNVTFFDNDSSLKIRNIADKNILEAQLNDVVNKLGRNSFYMLRLTANFNEILVCSEAAQKAPYPTLVNALKADQKEFKRNNINGTIIGLYCPDYMNSLNSVGWHFHFVSNDRKFGGHVLQLNIKSGTAQFDKTDNFNLLLPSKSSFHNLELAADLREDIRKAENDSKPHS